LSETLQAQLGDVIPGIQGVVYGIAIILVVLLAPEGIFLARARPAPAFTGSRRSTHDTGCTAHCGAPAPGQASPAHCRPILAVSGISKSLSAACGRCERELRGC